jgi:hypothetical protein
MNRGCNVRKENLSCSDSNKIQCMLEFSLDLLNKIKLRSYPSVFTDLELALPRKQYVFKSLCCLQDLSNKPRLYSMKC